ncbi:MAG: S41 family peptidase [Myxococcales bacterium]|nr:S41 family peptidase [Myxococcales bacterium]
MRAAPITFALFLGSLAGCGAAARRPAARGATPIVEGKPPATAHPKVPIDAATRTRLIEAAAAAMEGGYVFPDLGGQAAAHLRDQAAKGAYDALVTAGALTDRLTADLRELTHDKHIAFIVSAQPLPLVDDDVAPSPEDLAAEARAEAVANFGFTRIERLAGNIGYLRLDAFMQAALAGDTAEAAMRLLAHTDALIIDLRGNGGGDPQMVQLMVSYLHPATTQIHINDFYLRDGDATVQFWTLPALPGPRYAGDVYVLTSGNTFSAAEEYAYDLQVEHRGHVVGEVTGGGANPGGTVRLDDHVAMFVPFGRAINPETKTNWEGVGVQPDVAVAAPLALDTAYLAALRSRVGKGADANLEGEIATAIADAERRLADAARPARPRHGR